MLFLNPQPARLPEEEPVLPLPSPELTNVYKANASERLDQLMSYSGLRNGRLMLIGADDHLQSEAHKRGFETFLFTAGGFELTLPEELPRQLDACILFCALERMTDPVGRLTLIRQSLRSEGLLMVISPTTDSRTARFFKTSWWEFNRTNLFYFSADTLQSLLIKAGFGDPIIVPDKSLVSLNYLQQRLASHPDGWRRHRILRAAASLSPFLRNKAFRFFYGRTRIMARSKTRSPRPLLSVIVPVYNERNTFSELMEQLLEKSIEGLDIEIVIVESNSADGTRDCVRTYSNHPRVQVILEDRPRGKGHAVRAGLQVARGDIVLFQDADLEYDVNDYDALLAPILHYENNFVLGSRHKAGKNSWKIRTFTNSPGLSAFFNFGHMLFLSLFNILYSQQLSDPFTMFKVFRRECIYGLSFECNRFDFDFEIVIKLLRKGYRPVELAVNYRSRSIEEGKKVSLFRDPLTWLRALIKFRNVPLYQQIPNQGDTQVPN
ncbi:MAG: glycosyltransferase [Acidobacteriaceae bacterium]|nr:glycosyltransferase [Acidobacteriaceae bacterium]